MAPPSPSPPAQTAKSFGGGGVQANARDLVYRHHYSAMDRLVGAASGRTNAESRAFPC